MEQKILLIRGAGSVATGPDRGSDTGCLLQHEVLLPGKFSRAWRPASLPTSALDVWRCLVRPAFRGGSIRLAAGPCQVEPPHYLQLFMFNVLLVYPLACGNGTC